MTYSAKILHMGEVPWKLDVFDTETFARSPKKVTFVCTDIGNRKTLLSGMQNETGWMWNGCAHQLPCHWRQTES